MNQLEGIKDQQKVTPDGKPVARRIHGVVLRQTITHVDNRGTLCEVYDPRWGISDLPIVYIYQFTILPGIVKGWAKHLKKDDRIFVTKGRVRIGLYDDRPDSPTYQMTNDLYLSDLHRSLVIIPKGVYHALQAIGDQEAVCISMPTVAYDFEDPDVYRLPPNTDLIPLSFGPILGG
jgi:dTDP-4-dehydrorhamnose 3,5-epimerase